MDEVLAQADLDLLMDALKSHESAAAQSGMLGDMLGALMLRSEEQLSDFQRKREAERLKAESKQRRLLEDVAMLKAKLILLRRRADSEAADRLLAEAKR